jgi:hypothetical protein
VKGNMIAFKDSTSYSSIKDRLLSSKKEEIISFLDSLGFKTQYYLLSEADEELNTICETDDAEVFHANYKAYREKYGAIFLFNDIEKDDLSPYYKIVNISNALFANATSSFMIGGDLIKCEEYANFAEYKNGRIELNSPDPYDSVTMRSVTYSTVNNLIDLYLTNRCVYCKLYREGYSIHGTFSARLKNTWGWKRYDAEYEYILTIGSGFYKHLMGFNNGIEVYEYIAPGSAVQRPTRTQNNGFFTELLGQAGSTATVTGTMEVWTSGISYSDRGSFNVVLPYQ